MTSTAVIGIILWLIIAAVIYFTHDRWTGLENVTIERDDQ